MSQASSSTLLSLSYSTTRASWQSFQLAAWSSEDRLSTLMLDGRFHAAVGEQPNMYIAPNTGRGAQAGELQGEVLGPTSKAASSQPVACAAATMVGNSSLARGLSSAVSARLSATRWKPCSTQMYYIAFSVLQSFGYC